MADDQANSKTQTALPEYCDEKPFLDRRAKTILSEND
jgi:hypothetical protein